MNGKGTLTSAMHRVPSNSALASHAPSAADDDDAAAASRAIATTPGALDALLKRIDWRLLPLLNVMYIVCYLNRSSIGSAHHFLQVDLGISDMEYSWAASIFFVSYSASHSATRGCPHTSHHPIMRV
jgi:hypothetical protein